jgi:hypothetical protein
MKKAPKLATTVRLQLPWVVQPVRGASLNFKTDSDLERLAKKLKRASAPDSLHKSSHSTVQGAATGDDLFTKSSPVRVMPLIYSVAPNFTVEPIQDMLGLSPKNEKSP